MDKKEIRGYVIGFFIGIITGFLITTGTFLYQYYRVEKEISLLEPNFSIYVQDYDENQLFLEIKSLNKEGSPTDHLSFEFKLGGELNNLFNEIERKMDCEIDSMGSLTQRVFVECRDIMPDGTYNVILNYTYSLDIWKHICLEEYELPLYRCNKPRGATEMWDFEDYAYSWSYKGEPQRGMGCFSLINLEYIQENNKWFEWIYNSIGKSRAEEEQKKCYDKIR